MSKTIRAVNADDRLRLKEIVEAVGNFNTEEITVAMELIDEAIAHQSTGDYFVYVYETHERILGYVCFGETPLTSGTFDLYWIVVDPSAQGTGVGRSLMRFLDDEMRRRGGRLLLIETSSVPSYDNTRAFYERTDCREIARIPGFYRPGDDKVIYARSYRVETPGIVGSAGNPSSSEA